MRHLVVTFGAIAIAATLSGCVTYCLDGKKVLDEGDTADTADDEFRFEDDDTGAQCG